MATNRAPRQDEREATAFRLKRRGAFSEALKDYARMYAGSVARGSSPMAELCFEQMFDSALLVFLKEGKQFKDRRELEASIRYRLCQTLEEVDCGKIADFESHLDDCMAYLFGRHEDKKSFSVEPHLLIVGKHEVHGSRGQPLVVDGTTYPSAAASYRAIIGELPNKMNRDAIKRDLKKAGRSVSD